MYRSSTSRIYTCSLPSPYSPPPIHVGLNYLAISSLSLCILTFLRAFLSGFSSATLLALVYEHICRFWSSTSLKTDDYILYRHPVLPPSSSLKLQDPTSRPRGKGVKNRPGAGLSVALGISTCPDVDVRTGKLTCT